MSFRILLYYFYNEIEDVDGYREWQLDLCKNLGLRGRILVASEGINGTCLLYTSPSPRDS